LTRAEIDLAELVGEIPNDADWETWTSIGLAIYAASGGSDQGGIVFDTWSAKSPKYNPYTTSQRWRHFRHSPPNRTGMGKLIKLALEAGWRPADREIAVGRRTL
jgi:putative DNA primase/helicase